MLGVSTGRTVEVARCRTQQQRNEPARKKILFEQFSIVIFMKKLIFKQTQNNSSTEEFVKRCFVSTQDNNVCH